MKIQVLSVSVGSKTCAAGKSYQNAEIAYKNLDQGKVESKNITQYSKVFKAVADATPTMFYDVAISKDDKGYWQWDSFVAGTPGEAINNAPTALSKAVTAPKSNYETPEERAARQVFIVKQSSITAALKFLEMSKEKVNQDNVLHLAQIFTDWVLTPQQVKKSELFDMPNDLEVE